MGERNPEKKETGTGRQKYNDILIHIQSDIVQQIHTETERSRH